MHKGSAPHEGIVNHILSGLLEACNKGKLRKSTGKADVGCGQLGWEWDGPWECEDWAYGPDWGSIPYPPKSGNPAVTDFVRRRRWVRRRRVAPNQAQQTAGAPPMLTVDSLCGGRKRGGHVAGLKLTRVKSVHLLAAAGARSSGDLPSVGSLAEAAAAAEAALQLQVLGIVEPGEALPVPHGWRSSGVGSGDGFLVPIKLHLPDGCTGFPGVRQGAWRGGLSPSYMLHHHCLRVL